ncbi:transmembrane protein, putative (macronuclear) [Tetrahymena thermophila SB210]|uniref:Transmembrane protein, putative n=1 Tax=Tetrahymena thermophila (strain SB210) TaxID=312017 RepID=Q236W4_TETTS|nr:transmembrane protein, putative [Tetrahymena thermophila SB210]EAR92386.2 transmembrane protein, putative [Tetrahymena thermophila SB210]|eukprot:XP_001012631.2 transmembrane protein, putative [Tetrahymena thermophila SB210]
MEEEKKEAPTFFYNENKDPDPDEKGHFFITQLQTLLVAIFITAMMQFSNHLAAYLIYCCPMYFFIVFIQWFAFWKPEADLTILYNIYNGVMFIVCLPIFFGVFFAVFHPTASLEFKQVQNCQLVGQLSKWIEFNEKYSILYINFEYEGQQYLGQACASNYNDAKTIAPVLPYKFYYKYDSMACGPLDGNNTAPQYHRLLTYKDQNSTEFNRNERILRTGGGGGHSGGGGGGSSHSSSSSFSSGSRSSSSSCYRDYKWSDVKIASWLCQDRDFDIEEYMSPKSCYVNFFSGNKAYQNGQQRAFMRDSYNFPLIAYKEHAYYPQADLVCLILFSYYNWILSFNSIFQYTANYFLKKIRRTSEKRQIAVQALEFKPNPNQNQNPIQIEQINKETPIVFQINQQQVNPIDNVDCMPQPQYMQQYILPQAQFEQHLNNPQVQYFNPVIAMVGPQQQLDHQNEDYIVKQPVKIDHTLQNPML